MTVRLFGLDVGPLDSLTRVDQKKIPSSPPNFPKVFRKKRTLFSTELGACNSQQYKTKKIIEALIWRMKRGRISSIPTEEKQHRLKCKSNAWLPPQERDNIDTTTTIVGLPDSVLLNIVSFLFSASISKPMSKTMLAFVSTNKCLQTRLRKDVLPLFPIEARLNVFDRAGYSESTW